MAATLPDGWTIKRESAAAAVLHWGQAPRRAGRAGRETIIQPSQRLELEIRYSEFGWVWANCFWAGSSYGGCAALEKWRRFAATPAMAAMAAAKEQVDRIREGTDDRHARAVRNAALELIAAVSRAPALDPLPPSQEPWPFAQHAGRPVGYYRVAIVPEYRQDVHDVAWWTGDQWLPLRPGVEDHIRRTVRSIEYPRAVVWAVDPPITPELSRQFDAWAGLHVDQPTVLQHLPMPAPRAAGGQLDLFA